jgi:hypothetical protein
MNSRSNDKLVPAILTALFVVVVFAGPSAFAQEEPTPVPEPAKEEPAAVAEPEEPKTASPPTAAAASVAAAPAEEPDPPMAAIPITYRQKTLITIGGKKAQAKGVVEFIVQPQGEEPVKVRVNILAKSKPKATTSDVLKELDFAIDERYKVNRTGDQKITVKALKKNPPIAITVKTQSLSGVSVTVGNG